MTTARDDSAIPVRPAAYIRVEDAAFADDMTGRRDQVIGAVRELGWPVPAGYADVGQPGGRYAALVEAVAAASILTVTSTMATCWHDTSDIMEAVAIIRSWLEHSPPANRTLIAGDNFLRACKGSTEADPGEDQVKPGRRQAASGKPETAGPRQPRHALGTRHFVRQEAAVRGGGHEAVAHSWTTPETSGHAGSRAADRPVG